MFAWFAKLWRDERGGPAVEFVLIAPILVVLFGGGLELGRAFAQAQAVERGLRSAALFAARTAWPLSAEDSVTVNNLARTGNAAGTLPYLAEGWAEGGANFQITSQSFAVGNAVTPVIQVSATVPFLPLVPDLLSHLGLSYTISLTHEQAYVGD